MAHNAQIDHKAAMEKEFGRPARPGFKLTRNLMSNKVIEIEANTPRSCDPSTELYWSM